MGGIGILRQQQFEINAEEVQVTFDDVKGVRKCNMFCIFFAIWLKSADVILYTPRNIWGAVVVVW